MTKLTHDMMINKSHFPLHPQLKKALASYRKKIIDAGNMTHTTVKEQDLILDELASFDLGKHILQTGGANGVWTDYMISPKENLEPDCISKMSLIESFLLFHSPVVLAQRELSLLSRKIAQGLVGNGKNLASVPCGVMRDLLSLDLSSATDVVLTGIDIDPVSLKQAQKLAEERGIKKACFLKRDAWKLNISSEFDFINSIGLNVYETDHDKVIDLYRQYYKALKPGGVLFTGILTWPPYIDITKSEWILEKIPKFDLHLEEVIHKDILDIKWLNFRKLAEIEPEFKKSGFSNIKIQMDSRCIFPAIIAVK